MPLHFSYPLAARCQHGSLGHGKNASSTGKTKHKRDFLYGYMNTDQHASHMMYMHHYTDPYPRQGVLMESSFLPALLIFRRRMAERPAAKKQRVLTAIYAGITPAIRRTMLMVGVVLGRLKTGDTAIFDIICAQCPTHIKTRQRNNEAQTSLSPPGPPCAVGAAAESSPLQAITATKDPGVR